MRPRSGSLISGAEWSTGAPPIVIGIGPYHFSYRPEKGRSSILRIFEKKFENDLDGQK
jgi:hypothetical protein